MHALVYKSSAKRGFDESSLNELSLRATHKNRRLEVTGFLYFRYGDATFLQYLEGPRPALDELMETIRADERHEIKRELPLSGADERLFPNWSMRRLTDSHLSGVRLEDVAEQVLTSLQFRVYEEQAAAERVQEIVRKIASVYRHNGGDD